MYKTLVRAISGVGLLTLLSTGCNEEPLTAESSLPIPNVVSIPNVAPPTALEQQKIFREKVEDPHGGMRYLRDDEFVIPGEVMDSLYWASGFRGEGANGVYLFKKPTKLTLEAFRWGMKLHNIKNADFYADLFDTKDRIFYDERIFSKDLYNPLCVDLCFKHTIVHERAHQHMAVKMTNEESKKIEKTYNALCEKKPALSSGSSELNFERLVCENTGNYQEFFARTVANQLPSLLDDILEKEYPSTYTQIQKVRKKLKL